MYVAGVPGTPELGTQSPTQPNLTEHRTVRLTWLKAKNHLIKVWGGKKRSLVELSCCLNNNIACWRLLIA